MSLRDQYLSQRAKEDAAAAPPLTETAIGEAVVAWLRAQDWDVYQEVKAGVHQAPVADIVATRGPVVWIIECKKAIGVEVLDQLLYWYRLGFANYFSAATFATCKQYVAPKTRISEVAKYLLNHFGMGGLYVDPKDPTHIIREPLPRLHRRPKEWHDIRDYLHPDQRTRIPAGQKGGNYSTPFQRTCDELRRLVEAGPISPKEAIEQMSHHYQCDSTARSCLIKWATQGHIRGVRIKRVGRLIYFAKSL